MNTSTRQVIEEYARQEPRENTCPEVFQALRQIVSARPPEDEGADYLTDEYLSAAEDGWWTCYATMTRIIRELLGGGRDE